MAKKKKNIAPLGDRVMIIYEELGTEEVTAGGIIIPETAQEPKYEGNVVAVGTGFKNDKGETIPIDDIMVGDRIMYKKYSGSEFHIDDERYLIVPREDIMCRYPRAGE